MNVNKRTVFTAGLGLALVLGSPVASAGPKDDDLKSRREQAAQLHGEGAALFAQGKFEEARAKFHDAFARSQNPNSLFNEAKSTLKAGHALEGAKLVKAYLALPENDKVTAEDRREADGLLNEAMAKLCTLDVRVSACNVDGREETGTVIVEVGSHVVKMSGSQGEKTKTVTCAAREVVIVTYEDAPTQTPTPKGEQGDWLLPATLGAIGVIGLGVGIGLGAASGGARSDVITSAQAGGCANLTSDTCRAQRSDEDTANGLATGSVIAYAGGGLFLVASAVTLLVTKPWQERPARTAKRAVHLSPALGGLWINGTF